MQFSPLVVCTCNNSEMYMASNELLVKLAPESPLAKVTRTTSSNVAPSRKFDQYTNHHSQSAISVARSDHSSCRISHEILNGTQIPNQLPSLSRDTPTPFKNNPPLWENSSRTSMMETRHDIQLDVMAFLCLNKTKSYTAEAVISKRFVASIRHDPKRPRASAP